MEPFDGVGGARGTVNLAGLPRLRGLAGVSSREG
jgi:hypothetical protein